MPVNPAQSFTYTAGFSYLPCYDGKKSRLTLWDAVQVSNALAELPGLVFEKHLDKGASFIVDLYRVEPARPEIPELVAVKTPRILSLSDNEPSEHDIDLYSLLLEIQILCHESIQRHPNIIGVLGIDWKQGVVEIPVPLLIVEYSKLGNLSSYLQSHEVLSTAVKIKLCLDIASGLNMIHRCKVVHGDLKLKNVLLFEESTGGFVAKIADFGCSITGFEHEEKLLYHGTQGYRAPELKDDFVFSIPDLQKCDIFAFGLCAWEILKNGKWYREGANNHATPPEHDIGSTTILLDEFDEFLDSTDISDISTSMRPDAFLEASRTAKMARNNTRAIIRDLLHHTANPIPAERYSMDEVVEIISSDLFGNAPVPETDIPALRFYRKSVGILNFSPAENRTPREAQCQAVADLQKNFHAMDGPDKCQALLILSHCHAHGYGVSVNFPETLRYIRLAADAGSVAAESVLPRFTEAVEQAHQPLGALDMRSATLLPEGLSEALKRVECRLLDSPIGHTYHARVREWLQINRDCGTRATFTVFGEDGVVFDIQPGDEREMAAIIHANIKNLATAFAKSHSIVGDLRVPLLQFVTSHGWLELLRLLTMSIDLRHTTTFEDDSGSNEGNSGNLLLAAASQGDSTMLRFLLEQGVAASASQGSLSLASVINALHLLSFFPSEDKEELAKMLVDRGADPNMSSIYSSTIWSIAKEFAIELSGPPMDVAIFVGDSDSVRILLALGADPLQKSTPSALKLAHSCLELAVALHLHEIVDIILTHLSNEKHVNVPKECSGLLAHLSGYIIGGKGVFQRWLLHGSEFKRNCIRTIKTCIQHGISIDSVGEIPLSALNMAANRNPCQHYVLEALLECGADPNLRGNSGDTPLHNCRSPVWDHEDNARTVRSLLRFGAKVDTPDNYGNTPAHNHAFSNSTASLKCLVEFGASLTIRNSPGCTPLYLAATNGSYDAVQCLLDAGSDIEGVSDYRDTLITPLGGAANYGKIRVMELLLKRGAKIYQEETGATVLNFALDSRRVDMLRLLLQKYGQLFCKDKVLHGTDKFENTPLAIAASHSITSVHELLLAGTAIDNRNEEDPVKARFSRTALAVTVESERYDITRYLLEKGASPFCRGPTKAKMWSYIAEALYWCARKPENRAKLLGLIILTKRWIIEYDLFNARDFAGRNVVQVAIFFGQKEALKTLVGAGAPWDSRIGRATQDWRKDEYVGLNSLSYAKALPRPRPRMTVNKDFIMPWTISEKDMDDVIEYLSSISNGLLDDEESTSHWDGLLRKNRLKNRPTGLGETIAFRTRKTR